MIREVLTEAWNTFEEVTPENDQDFGEFVVDKLILEKGANDVVWYCSVPNCWFIVKFGSKYYDVDYVSYKINEVDEEYYKQKRREVWLD